MAFRRVSKLYVWLLRIVRYSESAHHKRQTRLTVNVMITLIFALFASVVNSCNGVDRPNIVFILADDLGWNDVAFHGSNEIQTPNIDALAYSGIILQNYHTLPICTPSRSALMTGIHPIHTGMQRIIYAGEPWGLPLDVKILPQYLKDDGYKTHAVGKWHLGFFKDVYTPTKRGFDSYFGYYTGKQDYYDHTSDIGKSWGYDMRRGMNVSWESYGHYTTDLITDEAVARIRNHDPSSPMFLYVAHLAVHSANSYRFLEAPDYVIKKFSYIENENRRTFAAMLWKLDESVGKIVEALQERNMLNNTIIVFSTDNGGPAAGFNNNAASNWPLRGVKDTLWEGGVRGSAFVWSPLLPKSRINNELMHIQDWLPTILAAVNSSALTGNSNFDGQNMWGALKEEKLNIYDELVLQIDPGRQIYALRKGDWKILSGDPYDGRWSGQYGPSGRDNPYSYNVSAVENSMVARALKKNNILIPSKEAINEIRKNVSVVCKTPTQDGSPCRPKNNACLFNVKNDPCEQTNLAQDKPEILAQLTEALKKYKPVNPRNKPNDPKSNPKFWNYTWTHWMDAI